MSRTRASGIIQELFAVDVRSLAVLRVALALVILIDLINRFSTIDLLYTSQGIFKDGDVLEYFRTGSGPGYWSLYWIQSSPEFVRTLFAINFLAAIGLLIGFQTRTMTILCLILAWSLQMCNPFVLTAGHILLRMMLMWGCLLPLGAVWSWDRKRQHKSYRAPPDSWHVTSIATAGIMIQLACVYFFAGISKLNPDWSSGQAMELSLNLEMYAKPFGQWLSEFPTLLAGITFATVGLEIALPILMFVPWVSHFFRGAAMAVFALMHIGIWSTMSIGIFTIVAISSWIIFLPTEGWNFWKGEPIGFGTERRKKWTLEESIRWVLAGVLLIFIVLMNVANVNPQRSPWFQPLRGLSRRTMSVQEFKMFSVLPKYSPWFEYRATLNSGDTVELFGRTESVPGEPPKSIYRQMKSQHWRRLHFNLINSQELGFMYDRPATENIKGLDENLNSIRSNLLEQIVSSWDKGHPEEEEVATADLILHFEPIELSNHEDGAADGAAKKSASFTWAHYQSR